MRVGLSWLLLLSAIAARPTGPVPVLPNCLPNGTASLRRIEGLPASGVEAQIDVAFLDTRRSVNVSAIRNAAALVNTSRVRFHLLVRYPQVDTQGFLVTMLSMHSHGACLYKNMARISHGPGPQYLYKPLLHYVMPAAVERLIVLDTDTVFVRNVVELYHEF